MEVFLSLSFGGVQAHYYDHDKSSWVPAVLNASGSTNLPVVYNESSPSVFGEQVMAQAKLTQEKPTDSFQVSQETRWINPLLLQATTIIEKEILYGKIEQLFLYIHPELDHLELSKDLLKEFFEKYPNGKLLTHLPIPRPISQSSADKEQSLLVFQIGYLTSSISFYRKQKNQFIEDTVISRQAIEIGEGSFDYQLENDLSGANNHAFLRQQIRIIRERIHKDKRDSWTIKSGTDKFTLQKETIQMATKEFANTLCNFIQKFTARCQKIYPHITPHLCVIEEEAGKNIFDFTPLKISLERVHFTSPCLLLGQVLDLSSSSMNTTLENYQEFYVLAPDGCQYGPASKDTIRRWIDEGRLTGDEQIMPIQWHPLSDLASSHNS